VRVLSVLGSLWRQVERFLIDLDLFERFLLNFLANRAFLTRF